MQVVKRHGQGEQQQSSGLLQELSPSPSSASASASAWSVASVAAAAVVGLAAVLLLAELWLLLSPASLAQEGPHFALLDNDDLTMSKVKGKATRVLLLTLFRLTVLLCSSL